MLRHQRRQDGHDRSATPAIWTGALTGATAEKIDDPQQRASALARDLWSRVGEQMRHRFGPAAVELWLKQALPLGLSRGIYTLAVPNEVVRDWLDHKYRIEIERIIHELTGSPVRVLLRVESLLPTVSSEPDAAPLARARDDRAPDRSDDNGAGEQPLPLLVVRAENKLASAALQRILTQPATGNPLFVYGPPGCGKTALVRHHLERHAREFGGLRTTLSVTAEAFSQALVRAIKDNALPAFRGRMLACDAFVLEEAHRLRGKPRTQREFLSILRYHIERGRPVILTSRHPPNAIFLLDEALRSYFLSGILLRIADYALPTRLAILEAHAQKFQHAVPLETMERIAQRVPGSFDRQLRFLEKTAAWGGLAGRAPTIEFLAEKFPELAGDGAHDVDIGAVIELVGKEFGVAPADITSNRKVRTAVLARHVVVYIATVVFNMKSRRVMRHLGGLSPSTTAYARRRVEQQRKDDVVFDARVRTLLERLDRGQKLLF